MTTEMNGPARDLIGYRNELPQANWPEGAKIAVNFCINYEEGAEMCILNGDDRSEARISDVAVEARIGERDLNIESSYEYGARAGYWRLLKAFTDRGLVGTVNLVGVAGEANPYALEAMIEAGFDLQLHGWRWIDYHQVPEDEEREHIARGVEQAIRLTGEHPLGYYAGLPSPNTRRLLVEKDGFLYDSDTYSDDLPYWTHDYGRPHLVLPYSLDTNDSRFGRREGYQTGDEFFTYIRDAFDCLCEEGETHPKMLAIGLHARLLGRPGRIGALHRILDHMLAHDKVWICKRGDIARHWAERHSADAV